MEVVFLIGAIQAVFLSFLVFTKKNKMLADKILSFWLLFTGTHLFSHYLFSINSLTEYPLFNGISVFFPMMEGVLMFTYVRTITQKRQKLNLLHLLHVIPYVVFTAVILFVIYTADVVSKKDFLDNLYVNTPPFLEIMSILNSLLGPIYIVICLIILKKHQRNVLRNFSYTEEIDLKWLRYVLIAMGTVWLVVILASIFSFNSGIISEKIANDIIYFTVTIAIFFEGYFGIKQQVIYSPSNNNGPVVLPLNTEEKKSNKKKDTDRYVKSGLKKEKSEKYLQSLLEYMKEDSPYIDGKLSLKQVAIKLDISTNYLSQVINENLKKNFFDFVNEYRVNLIKQKMKDPDNSQYTLLALAYDCGFNSKSSFNVIFKKNTGLTPSEYLKSEKT